MWGRKRLELRVARFRGDIDGDGKADIEIAISGIKSLSESDFILS